MPAKLDPCRAGNSSRIASWNRPSRTYASMWLMPEATTCTSTWPGPGTGRGTTSMCTLSTVP